MFDRFERKIDYLRVSVTDRCNLRCVYCMPEEGIALRRHDQILSYEDILTVVGAAADIGIRKIRVTGGEPLVRRDLEVLIRGIAATAGIEEVALTTNGSLLPPRAATLKASGLDRVNISLDSLDPERYRQLTRGGDVQQVLAGIHAALETGLTPIKINMVLLEDTPSQDVADMRAFCASRDIELQTIARFSLSEGRESPGAGRAERPGPCSECNRLRLTADGYLKPCLMSDKEIKVDLSNPRDSLLAAINAKPEQGDQCHSRPMAAIGG